MSNDPTPSASSTPGAPGEGGAPASGSLASHGFDAHRHRLALHRQAMDRLLEEAAARVPPPVRPEELGLELCPECGLWRDPIPETALESPAAFATYQEMARARCLCTSNRCSRCGEVPQPGPPIPRWYDPEPGRIVSGGGVMRGWGHAMRCGGSGGG